MKSLFESNFHLNLSLYTYPNRLKYSNRNFGWRITLDHTNLVRILRNETKIDASKNNKASTNPLYLRLYYWKRSCLSYCIIELLNYNTQWVELHNIMMEKWNRNRKFGSYINKFKVGSYSSSLCSCVESFFFGLCVWCREFHCNYSRAFT